LAAGESNGNNLRAENNNKNWGTHFDEFIIFNKSIVESKTLKVNATRRESSGWPHAETCGNCDMILTLHLPSQIQNAFTFALILRTAQAIKKNRCS
jgi:hypothetical protein